MITSGRALALQLALQPTTGRLNGRNVPWVPGPVTIRKQVLQISESSDFAEVRNKFAKALIFDMVLTRYLDESANASASTGGKQGDCEAGVPFQEVRRERVYEIVSGVIHSS